MPGLRRVHRFRDHPIEGVNWRPTQFVDEVPSSGVCGFCRMIPKRIVVLPCLHALCQSCQTDSSQGTGGRCPLDQEPFEEAECVSYDLLTRKVNALKVYCWNEAHGCQFEGSMEYMLRHYERECTFHTVECLRCGEEVLYKELSTHYVAGCRAVVSSARAGNASSNPPALTLQDVTAAFEQVKTLLRDANHELLLLAIQSQMNELVEEVRNKACRSAEITHAVEAPESSETAQVEVPCSPTSLQEGTSRQNPIEDASTSSTRRSHSDETLMPRQLDLPREVLQAESRTSPRDYPQNTFTGLECHILSTRPLSMKDGWEKVLETVTYVLTLANFHIGWPSEGDRFADITVLYTKDAYLTVRLLKRYRAFCLEVSFRGRPGGSGRLPPAFVVKACNLTTGAIVPLTKGIEDSYTNHHLCEWIERQGVFLINTESLMTEGVLTDGIKFEIKLSRP